jgi:hypothetical protein
LITVNSLTMTFRDLLAFLPEIYTSEFYVISSCVDADSSHIVVADKQQCDCVTLIAEFIVQLFVYLLCYFVQVYLLYILLIWLFIYLVYLLTYVVNV